MSIDIVAFCRFSHLVPADSGEIFYAGSPVRTVFLLHPDIPAGLNPSFHATPSDAPFSGETLRRVLDQSRAQTLLFMPIDAPVRIGYRALERMLAVLEDSGKGLVYGDYLEERAGRLQLHPTTELHEGGARDSFHFGPLVLVARKHLDRALENFGAITDKKYAGFYELWLKVFAQAGAFRIPEVLSHQVEMDLRLTGAKQHDYLKPNVREMQIELEEVFTQHLKRIGAWLEPRTATVEQRQGVFPCQASVIIPVKNREKTIADAVRSALAQKCGFDHNVIVVNNHSSDRTGFILNELCAADHRLVHVIPQRDDLGIGGCWDWAIRQTECGCWAVQLDSDDLYTDEHALACMVDKLEEGPFAMAVGSYRMVNFELQELPPGVIDHREWTDANGHNNLLRVNGIGAPRAFHTATLRRLGFPNITYGEDYAVGLRFTREYALGRVFEPVYLCRRWEDNSDAALPLEVSNRYTAYKDRIRALEILARQQLNAGHLPGAGGPG